MNKATSTSDLAASVIAGASNSAKAATAPKASANPAGVMKRSSSYFIDPLMVKRRPGWNNRFDMGDIEGLAQEIKVLKEVDGHGLLNDIRVKRVAPVEGDPRCFELVDGDRRMSAIELLIKRGEVFSEGIPAKIEANNAADLDLLYKMFQANGSKPLLPLEEAAAYKRMRDAGQTIKQICDRVGRKQVHVVASLALFDADDEVTEAVKSGAVNSTMAKNIAVAARGNKDKQKQLIADAKAAGKDKTKRKVVAQAIDDERRAKAAKKGQVLKIRALSDLELSEIGNKLSAQLAKIMKEAKLPEGTDLNALVCSNDQMAVAFTFGALQALKAAAGLKINLSV